MFYTNPFIYYKKQPAAEACGLTGTFRINYNLTY